MYSMLRPLFRHSLAVVVVTAIAAACGDNPAVGTGPTAPEPLLAQVPSPDHQKAIAALRRATDRYHRLSMAIADGFVFLHPCEVRPGEGPVGMVYVNPQRLDGSIDLSQPEALVYEPRKDGPPKLVAVELAIPYAAWSAPQPPQFLGATFQAEDEFQVFGLHVWVWRQNPNGLFEEANPRVRCDG